ncbi:2-phospho-L-lactate guanylyltransferase [Roseibium sp.]|uniref:2-phospho-L-lactate guanylyltransferase n=1 Tax=Roseibium sp. TaxID=1936156 RepID=UPI003B511BAB
MTVWALLPVKNFAEAKSRLGTWLPNAQRAGLARAMYEDTLAALAASAGIERIAVVSSDEQAHAIATRAGALCLDDPGLDLNAALEAGRSELLSVGASIIVVFPADIPALRPQDADAVVDAGREDRAAVIVPDHLRTGTNALLLHRNMPLRYSFGPDSFQAHTRLARESGFEMHMLRLRNIECDCDTPEDILRLTAVPPGKFTTRSLENLQPASEGSVRFAR